MTAQQLLNRVQVGADARFGDVIERLLSLLEAQHAPPPPRPCPTPQALVYKWHQTGLLDGLPDFVQETLAGWLEDAAHKLIDWQCLEDPDPKDFADKCEETLLGLRNKAHGEYERVLGLCKTASTEHYNSLYHRHEFS